LSDSESEEREGQELSEGESIQSNESESCHVSSELKEQVSPIGGGGN